MSTATAEKTQTVRFEARCPDQIFTRRPEQKVSNGFGGFYVETRETYLRDMKRKNEEREVAGLEPLPIDDSPWKVQFTNHIYETDDPRIIEFLREQKTLGTNGPSGFYEAPPVADPVADVAVPMKQIARAAAEADVDTLVAIRDETDRPAVAEAAVAALEAIAEEPSESEADAGSTGDGHGPDGSDGAA